MDILEKVEKIREKTGVSYEDAKAAIEHANGDVLDAIVYLEGQGKIKKPEVSVYSTRAESSQEFKDATRTYENSEKDSFRSSVKRFSKWVASLIRKGCENFFVVTKNGAEVITIPVLVLILCLLFAFWIVLPLMVVGLFCGFRYRFKGEITKSVDVNTVCDKAAEACDSVKQEFTK